MPPLFTVPRDEHEWRDRYEKHALKAGDAVTIPQDGLPVYPTSVKAGDYVLIYPSGNRCDDAISKEVELGQLGYVLGVARDPTLGGIVKLKWMLRKDDTSNACNPPAFHQGASEVLVLEKERSYEFASLVHSIIPVVSFDTSRISVPLLDNDTLYIREDVDVTRCRDPHDPDGNLIHRINIAPKICFPPCAGLYNPDDCVLRFCDKCSRWQHVKCLKRRHEVGATLTLRPHGRRRPTKFNRVLTRADFDERLRDGKTNLTYKDYRAWLIWLKIPLQRGHTGLLSQSKRSKATSTTPSHPTSST
ncbi:hypothetical protein FKP32DRAFT_1679079 [Trametes sanguinea]|nr:hypothetical protein FKP32DRAFT_1679079 [Trametes sanguinea]